MRIRDLLGGIIGTALAAIALNIFLPGWVIRLVLGFVTVLFIYNWIAKRVGLDQLWVKRILALALLLAAVHLFSVFMEKRWPWLSESVAARGRYTTYKLSDRANPDFPEELSVALHKTEAMILNMEEGEYVRSLQVIQDKILKGQILTDNDREMVVIAKKKFAEIQTERAAIDIVPQSQVNRDRGRENGEQTYTFPEGVDEIEVPLHPTKWSGWVRTPPGSHWRIDQPDKGWTEVKFLDGSRSKLISGEPVWFGKRSVNGWFRLRGESGEATVTLVRK